MLTSELVRVRMRKGVVSPSYVKTTDESLRSLAQTLINVFEQHVDSPRQELEAELKERLGSGTSFLVHRGLSKLLTDRCDFESRNTVEPQLLREHVFTAAANAYQSHELVKVDRNDILSAVAAELEMAPEDVDRQLYGDLKEAEVLQSFKTCSPEWLLQRYNVALAQGVLIRASSLDLTIQGETTARYREVFRKLKFFQLLHEIRPHERDGYRIHIDGPMSLFKSSQRYGLQMASFFPTVLHGNNWSIEAEVRWGPERKAGTLKLSPKTGLEPISRSTGQWLPEEVSWLDTQFAKLKTDWRVSTDGEIIDLGGEGILAPDFVFIHEPTGAKVYMEVMGYWRKGAVQSRLDLLARKGPANLILAVSKELGVDEDALSDLPGALYLFRTTPVARDVHKLLKAFIPEEPGPMTLF
ncbi:MAG: DUF790 family protein [Candidatus Latescibacteria bacterium]|nr:DUF790 family protein [Candidatus Latescibacterota bacterium]